jgi:hypothetical protein
VDISFGKDELPIGIFRTAFHLFAMAAKQSIVNVVVSLFFRARGEKATNWIFSSHPFQVSATAGWIKRALPTVSNCLAT